VRLFGELGEELRGDGGERGWQRGAEKMCPKVGRGTTRSARAGEGGLG
jgi:hypothetical protein